MLASENIFRFFYMSFTERIRGGVYESDTTVLSRANRTEYLIYKI